MTKENKKNWNFIWMIITLLTIIISCCFVIWFVEFKLDYKNTHKPKNDAQQYYSDLETYVSHIRTKTDFVPDVAITLGSGLDEFEKEINVVSEIKFSDIDNFPRTTNPDHEGKFIFGIVNNTKVVCMKGRLHNYEGYNSWEVVIPVRVCHMLGASKIILTNSVGTLDPNYKIGDLTVVTNCISKFIESPLVGSNIDQLGERFPDTSKMYDANLNNLARECAKKQNIILKDSIYIQFNGPNFETSADAKMARQLGATTIGMSSVVDAIAAAHMNMQICNIGSITASSIDGAPPMNDEEVRKAANASISNLSKLILEMLK